MEAAPARLREILVRPYIKAKLDDARKDVFAKANNLPHGRRRDIDRVRANELHPGESQDVRAAAMFDAKLYRRVLETKVLNELTPPRPVTLRELEEAFVRHLLVPDGDFNGAYASFVADVLSQFWSAHSKPFALAHGGIPYSRDLPAWGEENEDLRFEYSIAEIEGFRVQGTGIQPLELLPEPKLYGPGSYVFHAQVEAVATTGGIEAFADEVRVVLPSIVRSVALLESEQSRMLKGGPRAGQ